MRPTLLRSNLSLLARLVCGQGDCFGGGFLVLSRHLVRSKLEGELVNGPGEVKRQLITVVYARAGIAAYVEALVDGHQHWNRVRDRLFGKLLAINCHDARTTLTRPGAVILE